MAPEIKDISGHTLPVDAWALGILTHEMLVGPLSIGDSAFGLNCGGLHVGDHPDILQENEVECGSLIDFPKQSPFTAEAIDFIRSLVVSSPTKRLQFDNNNDQGVATHRWLDRSPLSESVAPYVPAVTSVTSITNMVPYHNFNKFLIARDRV